MPRTRQTPQNWCVPPLECFRTHEHVCAQMEGMSCDARYCLIHALAYQLLSMFTRIARFEL